MGGKTEGFQEIPYESGPITGHGGKELLIGHAVAAKTPSRILYGPLQKHGVIVVQRMSKGDGGMDPLKAIGRQVERAKER
jgi:hypothetical protein